MHRKEYSKISVSQRPVYYNCNNYKCQLLGTYDACSMLRTLHSLSHLIFTLDIINSIFFFKVRNKTVWVKERTQNNTMINGEDSNLSLALNYYSD